MILSFKKRFIKPIIKGTKIHTFREDKKNRWKAGRIIHFATGVRTKNYNQFFNGKCISIQEIAIIHRSARTIILIDGVFYCDSDDVDKMKILMNNDGFKNQKDFWNWFDDHFDGIIIHWTDFKY